MNFNHFIGITYTPSAEDLKEAFVRRAAFVAMHEQRGADRFIPILLNAGREEPFDIQDSDISVIYIQDKNHQEQESSWEYSATWKLSHRFVHQHSQTSSAESFGNRPYVSIYCQWGNSVRPAAPITAPRNVYHQSVHGDQFCMARWGCDITDGGFTPSIIIHEGISREAALKNLQSRFDRLRSARPDPYNLAKDDAVKQRLVQMIPLRYKIQPESTLMDIK